MGAIQNFQGWLSCASIPPGSIFFFFLQVFRLQKSQLLDNMAGLYVCGNEHRV